MQQVRVLLEHRAANTDLVVEYDDRSLLLTGDSHGDVLTGGIRRIGTA